MQEEGNITNFLANLPFLSSKFIYLANINYFKHKFSEYLKNIV